MKNLLLLVFALILSHESYSQKTSYYKYAAREVGNKDDYLSNTTLQLSENGRTISISLNGKINSYSSMLGDIIQKDYNDNIIKIGSLEIKYDYSRRVEKVGETSISYSNGRMEEIGKYDVIYDYNGKFQGTKEKVSNYNYRW